MKCYLYVTKFFPRPGDWRGAYCLDFVRALQRALEVKRKGEGEQWNVLVFVEGDGSDYDVDGVQVHTFKTRYLPSNIFPFLFKRYNQKSFIEKVKVVCQGQQWSLDDIAVCHAHTANFGVYCEALKRVNPKCKTLLHHHDLQSFGLNMGALRHCWFYNLIQFPLLRRLHERMDCHVFISEAARRSFLAAPNASWTMYADYKKQMRGLPYRPARIKDSVILHNGVDKGIFKVERVGRGGQQTDNSFIIGCVGNFQELKGQETLIRAVARVNEVEVEKIGGRRRVEILFVGSGERLETCWRLAEELGVDAEFLREVSHEKLADFYRGLDLFVLPSTFEGFGCVYTEAHSCGVPFIACEGQGTDDIIPIEDRGKWLCKQNDPEDLARKIGDYVSRVERGECVEQRLTENQDIDYLVGKFVRELGIVW